ncbi:hypothetical protein ACHAXN_000155 [Cyclotella atomus]
MSLFLRSVLYDLDIPQDAATTLYEDNEGATTMANAGKPTPRSRHINTNFYAIQEWVECDLVILQRIDTSINLADPLTKSLNRILFHRHRDFNMGLFHQDTRLSTRKLLELFWWIMLAPPVVPILWLPRQL